MSSISPTTSTSTTTGTSSTTSSGSTTSSDTTSPFAPAIQFNGVISGLDTSSIINALMQAYEQPQVDIQNQINSLNTNLNDYQQLSSDFLNLQTAANNLNVPSDWQVTSATTSDPSVATATTTSGATPSTISFNVDQLAQGNVLAGANTLGSLSSTVASGNFLLSSSASGFGVSSLAGSGLAVGNHSFAVTQALTGGTATGSSALASSITIGSSNDTIDATVNGTAESFTIASGTYTPSQLAQAVSTATSTSGTPLLNAQVNTRGQLEVGTSLLGSSASLQITGGSALSSLGLSTQSTASVGTAGSITLDGTATAINNVQAGSTTTLTDGTGGTVTMGIGTFGLDKGSFSASEISAGSGSLSSVVSNINAANAGVTASAVQVGTNAYILQLSSNSTGTDGNITVEASPFSASVGSFNTVTEGQNALISVGGSGGYELSSQTNTVSGVLPGVDINLVSAQAPGSSPITLSVTPDGTKMATQVQALVTAANTALSDINTYAGYNAATGKGGPLMGNADLNALTSQILGVIANAVGANGTTAANAGITLNKNGSIDFNATTFANAYDANPSQVASIFTQGGTLNASSNAYSGSVSFSYASNATQPGSYAVVVSHSATQAVDTGSVVAGGAITSAETLSFTSGGITATYAASAGESLANIAAGINASFASAGLGLAATVNTTSSGSQLVVSSENYGSAQSFTVATSGTTGQLGLTANGTTYTGTDVAGTIDGVAATGSGQFLTAPLDNPTLAGLSLQITATGITSATNLGNFNYTAGIAGGMGITGYGASDPVTGSLSSTISSINQQISSLQQQYNSYTPMIQNEQQMLQQEFDNMEAQLGTLKNQGSYLSGEIAQLSTGG
ncbi:MAG: flagellar filament capping protein FliD [Ferrimicrobium sp.]|jgi:flagellar hook-associated protein 2|nr:flagellar filament capping protein FliD [Ferrimicrobium sp.]